MSPQSLLANSLTSHDAPADVQVELRKGLEREGPPRVGCGEGHVAEEGVHEGRVVGGVVGCDDCVDLLECVPHLVVCVHRRQLKLRDEAVHLKDRAEHGSAGQGGPLSATCAGGMRASGTSRGASGMSDRTPPPFSLRAAG